MPLTLDPTPALIVVDLQKGIAGMTEPAALGPLVARVSRLVDAFHAAQLPVVWVHATGLPPGRVDRGVPGGEAQPPAYFAELLDELPVAESDHHVFKPRTFSAFAGSGLERTLHEQAVTQVVIVGIATGGGVESTARSAYDAHLTVTVPRDACYDPDPARHDLSLRHALPGIGLVTTVDEVVAALPGR